MWFLVLTTITLIILFLAKQRLRQTTLVQPLFWAMLSVLAVTCAELADRIYAWQESQSHLLPAIEFGVAAITFCPIMSLLGAKRPQNRGWIWIVLSLLATLWLPLGQWFLLNPGGVFELSPVWKTFCFVLLLLAPMNFLPTRNMIPVLFVLVGQVGLLHQQLPLPGQIESRLPESTMLLALYFFTAAAVTSEILYRLAEVKQHAARFQDNRTDIILQHEIQWQRFRNSFGAFWAIRVMQRINETAEIQQWPLELGWFGFVPVPQSQEQQKEAPGEQSPKPTNEKLERQIEKTFKTVLRRFV